MGGECTVSDGEAQRGSGGYSAPHEAQDSECERPAEEVCSGVMSETTDRRGLGEMAISKPYRSPWVFDTLAKNFDWSGLQI